MGIFLYKNNCHLEYTYILFTQCENINILVLLLFLYHIKIERKYVFITLSDIIFIVPKTLKKGP
jgi:hypothetical protein